MSGREACLESARLAVSARGKSYGRPEDLFAKIAKRWSLTLGIEVAPRHIALMMIDLKIERALAGTALDNPVDIAGYAACLYEIDFPAADIQQLQDSADDSWRVGEGAKCP